MRHPGKRIQLKLQLTTFIIKGTALHAAIQGGNEKVVQLLLEAGADPNVILEGSGTALQLAVFEGNESIVKRLLKANADANLTCKFHTSDVRHP